ncbi:MAG: 2OG-Fe(II) oxygenase [Planctomycetota bacterium]|nr:MAG: 2OG-Fe(II) oxygenase [Planctomycetota bacterium]
MPLQFGEPAPWFTAPTPSNPTFHFDTAAGRYIVLCFLGSASDPLSREVWRLLTEERRGLFDDRNAALFGVSIDPADRDQQRLQEFLPGVHVFWDFDHQISRRYRALAPAGAAGGEPRPLRHTLLLDQRLRTLVAVAFGSDPRTHVEQVAGLLKALPPVASQRGHAPILSVPRVFEPEFCRELIEYYNRQGGKDSGFMQDRGGKTVGVIDYSFKRRYDCEILDQDLRRECMVRVHDRLVPEIRKAFNFNATRMERYIVCCYDASVGGYFRAHRDNTTRATEHRRFAVTLNLNAEEFEGGGLRFPEFGPEVYRAPTGGAIVFSCSLLHEAMPVTKGKRYVFLPFLYDDAAAEIRQRNQAFLAGVTERRT